MSNPAADFLQQLRQSVRDGSFLHLVLSRPVGGVSESTGSETRPAKISVRPVELKSGLHLQFTETVGAQERHRNLDGDSACAEVESLFGTTFRHGHLYTTECDLTAKVKGSGVRLARSKPSRKKPASSDAAHDRTKQYLIPEGKPCAFLTEIGVMTAEGKVRSVKYDKFRQINRYLEFVEGILPELPTEGPLRVVDFGCGKSYLTFALHWLLTERHQREVDIRGLDLKADVIRNCSSIATRLSCHGLSFEIGSIESCQPTTDIDMTVSLHACDTATDAALGKAVEWNSKVILAVPCCQHELSQRLAPELLPPIQRHGILRERFASMATDSLRALALEILGYKTQIVEFIDMDHTAKNLLIRAIRRSSPPDTAAAVTEYRNLRGYFGPEPIALERFLGVDLATR